MHWAVKRFVTFCGISLRCDSLIWSYDLLLMHKWPNQFSLLYHLFYHSHSVVSQPHTSHRHTLRSSLQSWLSWKQSATFYASIYNFHLWAPLQKTDLIIYRMTGRQQAQWIHTKAYQENDFGYGMDRLQCKIQVKWNTMVHTLLGK